MNRRRFLREGIAGGAIVLGAGGFIFFRRQWVRAEVTSRMLEGALPALASNSLKELQTLPVRAREQISRYFHGKCLNVEGFVSRICSNEFAERLGRCLTQDDKEVCFLQEFCAHVAPDSEMVDQVGTIASDIGSELDSGWAGYCAELSAKWKTCIGPYGNDLAMDEVSNRVGQMIRAELARAAHEAVSAYQRPAVGATLGRIGESALLLLPLGVVSVRVGGQGATLKGNVLLIPAFFLSAARHLWDYIAGRLADRRAELQATLSRRLAELGKQASAEFEREVRRRLADLHTWRERSVREAARQLAEERIGFV